MKSTLTFVLLFTIISGSFGQKTYIPDSNFEAALIFEGLDNVLDDSITTSIIDTLTTLDLEPFNIVDLTGIEDFSALKTLICRNNDIQQLNLNNNFYLEFLNCENNNLTQVLVNNCGYLKHLFAENNNLTGINIGQSPFLETLELSQNPLVSGNFVYLNTELKILRFSNCSLSSANVAFNINLEVFDISNNPLLTDLDVTMCTELTSLDAHGNSFTQLDLSNNSLLELLFVADNQLTSLDLQNNTLLTSIICYNNNLSWLNLPSINTQSTANLATVNNPNLFCIQCDNPAYVNSNWTVSIDTFTQIATICNLGITELEASIKIFPNPTENGWISINSEAQGRFRLIDLNGSLLKNGEIQSGKTVIDVSELKIGMYIIQLQLNGQLLTRRIEIL